MDTPSTPPLEELLTHARWARALARQLLRDEQRADDVVQEAWLAAVERPPRPGPGLRAWFARLIRNLANNQRRAELRRALHERGAAAPELAASSAAPVVDEFAAQQLVAQALLALDEPYRETLLRRWFRDEKPAAIAHAMQVPVKTVDTRLARGLERLRAELTARRGGTSREWCVMLAPLAQAGTATGVVAAWTGGALTTAGLAKLAAATVVAAAAVATWSKVAAHRSDDAKAPPERAVASAPEAAGAPAPVAVAAAADGATRSKEAEPATTATADDPLAKYRGDWHLRGRVVEEGTGKPVVGCVVKASVANGVTLVNPLLAETRTDANGAFALERLSSSTRIWLRADGHVPRDTSLREADLADDRAAAPRQFTLEPRTYGTLVVRLHARNGKPLQRSIAEGAVVLYGPSVAIPENNDRFDGLPALPSDGTPVEMLLPAERKDDTFRIERAPARVDLRLTARVGRDVINTVRLEPLAPGETREIPLAVESGIVVPVRCFDAATREPLPVKGIGGYAAPLVRWTGARPRDHSRRTIAADVLDGPIVLPGPGRVEIEGTFEGYAPFRVAAEVADGTPVEIALTRWRKLLVKVRDAHGDPWKWRAGSVAADTTTRPKGIGFLAAGRAPSCVVVAAGVALPSEIDPDVPIAARLGPKLGFAGIDGFLGFAPAAPLRVGIYADGRRVGSAEVPSTAPFLVEELRARPSDGVRTANIAADALDQARRIVDEKQRAAASIESTQIVTVDVALPAASDGALRFRAVGRADGSPVARYDVTFEPVVLECPDADGGGAEFKVDDPVEGLFSLSAIPAGDWRMRIRMGPKYVDAWSGRISIGPGRTTDLGTLTLDEPGSLAIRVVEVDGSPTVDAEILVATADGARPVEFSVVKGFSRQTSTRTTSRSGDVELELAPGKVRVEVRSDGFAPAFADVAVPPNGKAACTIVLKSLEPGDVPGDAKGR
jgi:RNA polymerase sigma-70 factor (ECF subfamily)